MILTWLYGGLGNQLFQYAIGRALALRHDVPLKLNVSLLPIAQRPYNLGHYPIQGTIATREEVDMFQARPGNGGLLRCYEEPHFHFDPGVLELAPPVHIVGYWQSELYFKHIAGVIRAEFTPVNPLEPENVRSLEKIESSAAVAVHVRRGDYVSNPESSAILGTPSLDYYKGAMNYIAARVDGATFYIFSDDPVWVRKNLSHSFPLVWMGENLPDRGFRDIQLMSSCKHHIIANSSFSWWGAWLCKASDKIVVAPTPWFRAEGYDTGNLLPSTWMAMPAQ